MTDSIRRLLTSLARASAGVGLLLREPNARIHVAASLTALGVGHLLRLSRVEWAIVLMNVGLVVTFESLNTAMESYVDLAAPGRHEIARRAKDAAAGAVLIASVVSVGVAWIIFGPRLEEIWPALVATWGQSPVFVSAYGAVTLAFLLAGVLWRDKWPARERPGAGGGPRGGADGNAAPGGN